MDHDRGGRLRARSRGAQASARGTRVPPYDRRDHPRPRGRGLGRPGASRQPACLGVVDVGGTPRTPTGPRVGRASAMRGRRHHARPWWLPILGEPRAHHAARSEGTAPSGRDPGADHARRAQGHHDLRDRAPRRNQCRRRRRDPRRGEEVGDLVARLRARPDPPRLPRAPLGAVQAPPGPATHGAVGPLRRPAVDRVAADREGAWARGRARCASPTGRAGRSCAQGLRGTDRSRCALRSGLVPVRLPPRRRLDGANAARRRHEPSRPPPRTTPTRHPRAAGRTCGPRTSASGSTGRR